MMNEPENMQKIENNSTAVLLCGMIREWELCTESFHENFISYNKSNMDIDVFLVTYDITDRYETNRKLKEKILDNEYKSLKKQFNTNNLHIINFETNKQKILEDINHINSDNMPPSMKKDLLERSVLESIYMQTYLLQQSLKLINKSKQYDCIMRTRFDIQYDQKFIIPTSLIKNCLYTLPNHSNQNFTDNCFLGEQETMKKILSSYDLLLKNSNFTMPINNDISDEQRSFLEINHDISHGHQYSVESLFLNNVKKNDTMLISNEQWKLSILRDKGDSAIPKHKYWSHNTLKLYGNRNIQSFPQTKQRSPKKLLEKSTFVFPPEVKGLKIV